MPSVITLFLHSNHAFDGSRADFHVNFFFSIKLIYLIPGRKKNFALI